MSPPFVFTFNFCALIPLSSLLGSATEELSLHVGGKVSWEDTMRERRSRALGMAFHMVGGRLTVSPCQMCPSVDNRLFKFVPHRSSLETFPCVRLTLVCRVLRFFRNHRRFA